MKRSKLLEIIKEILGEQEGGAVGNVAAAMDGGEGSPKVPAAFTKPGQGENKPTKMMKKTFGYTAAPRPKHPSSSDAVDYLDENKK